MAPFYKGNKVWRGTVTAAQKGQKASSRPHTESAAQEDTGDPLNWGPAGGGGPRGCATASLWEGVSSSIPTLSPCTLLIV